MIVVRTLFCDDGVIGLNGWRYLLNTDDTLMKFTDKESANNFLKDNDINCDEIDLIDEESGELSNWVLNC